VALAAAPRIGLIEYDADPPVGAPDRVAMTQEVLRTMQSAPPPPLNASMPCLRTRCRCAVRRSIMS
jgi:hypothetical protein